MGSLALPRPVGFVLGGGGSLGAAQVGMLRALGDAGIVPDVVVGTSVGSLNGAIVAADPERAADVLRNLWARTTREKIFPGRGWLQIRTLRDAKTFLYSNDGLIDFLREELPVDTFAELRLPFGAVATDAETAEPVVITSGLLSSALLASTAIPAVFPPVWRNGRTLYDGGLVANVPMRQAIELGARSLVVLDCTYPGQSPKLPDTMFEVITLMSVIIGRRQAVLELPAIAKEVPVLYLPGADIQSVNPLDFRQTPVLMEGARRATAAFLESLAAVGLQDGPGLYGSVYAAGANAGELSP
jgi:NTE family protein